MEFSMSKSRYNEPNSYRQTLSIEEVASILGLHRLTVRAAIDRGDIHAIRIGRRYLIPKASLEKLLGRAGEPGIEVCTCETCTLHDGLAET